MPIPFDLPTLMVVGPFIVAVVVYLWLRWGVWDAGKGTSPVSASRHAGWVGVLGWMASSLNGATRAGTVSPAFSNTSMDSLGEILAVLSWPVLGCLLVHAIGQISYPGHKGTRRRASLSVRRIRNFLPRRLAWVTTGIFVFAACFIVWAAGLPAIAATERIQTADGYPIRSGQPGRINGWEFAVCLGSALLVLAVGTVVVLLLITRRRQLEGLSDSDNQRLRSIAMNRLLRTVATVAAGLGAIAGNFGMNTPPGTTAPFGGINYAGIVNIAVLVVMWRWRPPRLADVEMVENRETAAGAGHLIGLNHPAGKLVMSLGPLLGLAAAFPLIPGFLFSAVSPAVQMPALYGPAGYVGCAAVLVLLVIAAGEFLLRTNHCSADVPRSLPKVAVSPALTLTAVAAFIIFLVLLAITAAGAVKPDVASGWMEAGLPAVVVVAVATLALLLTSKRPGIRAAPPGLDAALRSITSFRIVRTIAAFFAAEAALLVLYEDQAISVALGFGPAARPEYWGLVSGAGGLLAVCAVVIAVIPVRSFVRIPGNVVPQAEMDSVT